MFFQVSTPAVMSYYRLALPSQVEQVARLRRWVAALANIEGYGKRCALELELVMHEAFVNAVVHGNLGPSRHPVVTLFNAGWNGTARFLDIRMRDFGAGFDPAPHLAVAGSEAARSRAGGRGLLLMSHYADSLSVEQLPDGCVVLMRYIPD
ncbi:MAG TPA: ATP-binding protein [Chlorobaculum parvum]|uniref:ATP-binding protein n=1 Tax=Chlorobaculum parvum TaxID=274539 RepID=A0A7C5HI17_9CHLB|nr:ATP-binding protein [Chlorobaculum parvum]